MTEVRYFPRYSQRENFATNNTLLLLYRLYDWNRFRFETFLSRLLGDRADGPLNLGLQISQQIGTGQSVLDGYLHQAPIRIAVEAKRKGSAFDLNQLERHLNKFGDGTTGYLLLLSPDGVNWGDEKWAQLAALANRQQAIVVPTTFDRIIRCAGECLREHDEEMQSLLEDFASFCSEEKLLSEDKDTIFVPPCSQSMSINEEFRLYFCPAHWGRRKTKYVGFYGEKAVRFIGEVGKVVYCELSASGELRAQDKEGQTTKLTIEEDRRIRGAIEAAAKGPGWQIATEHKFYLCNELQPTDFKKESSGGIQGHRYLRVSDYLNPVPTALEEIAERLKVAVWI